MVWQAEKDGILTAGKEIVDATSGNTGVALAYVAAARGYKITLTMPETMSTERKRLLRGLGVNLVLTEGSKGMKGAIAKAEEIVASDPSHYVMLKQFDNPAKVSEQAVRLQVFHVLLNKTKVRQLLLLPLNQLNHQLLHKP